MLELALQLALLGLAGLFLMVFGIVWLLRRRSDRGGPKGR
jgi:hypothetical protein